MADLLNLTGVAGTQDWQRAQDDRAVSDLKHPTADNPKKMQASARAFESLLIGKWLEAAEQSLGTVPGGTEEEQEDGSVKQLSSLGTQSLAESISAHGGFGIAKMLLASIKEPVSH